MTTSRTDSKLAKDDFRRLSPRFQEGNLDANLKLVEAVKDMATAKGCAPGQIALAWLLAQGPEILPIPGTRRIKYLEENLGAIDVVLSTDDLNRLNAIGQAAGERYPEAGMKLLNI